MQSSLWLLHFNKLLLLQYTQVTNRVDRRNECTSDRERTAGQLRQLTSERAPHHLRLVGMRAFKRFNDNESFKRLRN